MGRIRDFYFIYLVLSSRLLLAFTNNIMDIEGKNVIITGGAQGIGVATVEYFLKYGARVIITDIDRGKGTETYNKLSFIYGKGRIEFINCDVTKCLETTYSYSIKKYKTIDLVVNNAGKIDEDSVKGTMSLNVVAMMEWSMKFMEHMRVDREGRGGTIINIASVVGYRIEALYPIYTGSKHGIFGFSKTLGYPSNFKKHGVRILTVCPGCTLTRLVERQVENIGIEDVSNIPNGDYICQLPKVVGEAIGEVYKKALSGTAWQIERGKLEEVV